MLQYVVQITVGQYLRLEIPGTLDTTSSVKCSTRTSSLRYLYLEEDDLHRTFLSRDTRGNSGDVSTERTVLRDQGNVCHPSTLDACRHLSAYVGALAGVTREDGQHINGRSHLPVYYCSREAIYLLPATFAPRFIATNV